MIPAFYNEIYDVEQRERRQELAIQRRILRNESNPFELPDEEFKKLYRLTKELTRDLITELEPYMDHGQRSTRLTLDLRVLAALRFFAHGSFQRCIGANENVNVAQQTMSDVIQQVCNAIENIAPRYITFPTTVEEIGDKKQDFWNNYNFPGVVGCVDGTYVAIMKPFEDEHLYLNRKGYHSKNVQIICDADLKILSINANFERCIGVFKMRFRCVNKERVLRYSPFKAGQIINCCAVLHNICVMGNVPLDEEDEYVNDDDNVELNNNAPQNVVLEGQQKRQNLVNAYFQE